MEIELPLKIRRQPDYTTCGPTSLHAVYNYFGDTITLEQVIDEVHKLEGGGTLSPHLAVHALKRGYEAEIWVCNVATFDPTWFQTKTDIVAKLKARLEAKGLLDNPRYADALNDLEQFIRLKGKLRWGDLTPRLIGGYLKRGLPILTGTNGTYLYQCMRETPEGTNDIIGEPFGHFLVVCGYHTSQSAVSIADPLRDNPLHGTNYYRASVYRLIGSIFLGASSGDSNFMVIKPKGWKMPKQVAAATAAAAAPGVGADASPELRDAHPATAQPAPISSSTAPVGASPSPVSASPAPASWTTRVSPSKGR